MIATRLLGRLIGFVLVLVALALRLGLADNPMTARGMPDTSPRGFSGDVRQPPSVGTWRATGTYLESKGYYGRGVGEQIERRWTTAKDCRAGTCSYSMTRQLADLPPVTATLRLQSDGWHATFPQLTLSCQPGHTWQQQTTFVFRFTHGGRRLRANEVHHSFADACGWGVSRVEWTAERVAGGREAPADIGPVGRDAGPVNGIREDEMAASVRRAVRADTERIATRISVARERHIELKARPHSSSCRSRENTRSRRGAAFQCSVVIYSTDTEYPVFTVQFLVAEIEGRCWRAINNLFSDPVGGIHRFPDSDLGRQLAVEPLRGCA